MIRGALSRGRAGQIANILGMTPAGNPQDTMLAHITPEEAGALSRMSGGMKRNPVSGLPAFWGAGDGDGVGVGVDGGVGDPGVGGDASGGDMGAAILNGIAQVVGPSPLAQSKPAVSLLPRSFQPFAAGADYGKPGGVGEHLFFRSPGQEPGSLAVGGGALAKAPAADPAMAGALARFQAAQDEQATMARLSPEMQMAVRQIAQGRGISLADAARLQGWA
jgi:hypothetical protein